MTKYNVNSSYGTVDNKLTLDLEDDAARAKMGGDWKMPTHALMEELVEETTSEWITNYNGSGINGRKFTSKKNSNSIFIPAAGERSGSSFYDQGSDGIFWSSSLYSSSPEQSRFLYFDSNNIGADDGNYRERGYTVRGVL